MSVNRVGCGLTLLLILTGLGNIKADISDLRRCADSNCKEPISRGLTVIGYPSNDEQILSFPINAEVTVYSKEAGSRPDLWGVEIKGKRGYVPKQYVREHKIFVSKLKYEMPTEGHSGDHNSAEETVEADSPLNESNGEDGKAESEAVDPKKAQAERVFPSEEGLEEQLDEEITLGAEDVEYNHLKKAVSDTHETDTNKEEDVHVDDNLKEEENNPEQEEENNPEQEEENEFQSNREDEEEEGNIGNDNEEEKEEEDVVEKVDAMEKVEEDLGVIPNEVNLSVDIQDQQNSNQPLNEQEDGLKNEDKVKDQVIDLDGSTQTGDISPTSETPSIDEVSPVNYEVIDGTTIYFDDTTPLPPTAEYPNPVNLMASSVTEQDYVSAHPTPVFSKGSQEDSVDQGANIQVTSTVELQASSTVVMDSRSDSVVTDTAVKPTETLPVGDEAVRNAEVGVEEPSVEPTSSWLSDATETVTSWFGKDEKEGKEIKEEGVLEELEQPEASLPDETDDRNDLGNVKEKSVMEEPEVRREEEKPSGGFFSSLFGSSEDLGHEDVREEIPEDVGEEIPEDVDKETPEDSVATKSDDNVNKEMKVDTDNISEVTSTEPSLPSERDPVDPVVPFDTMPTLVEPSESPEINAQTPDTAGDVDNVSYTQHSTLSSVGVSPDTTTLPDLEETSESPLDHRDEVSGQDSSDLVTAALGDQVDLADDTGDDEDPSTSTARPLYAAPDPSSQESHSENHVDPDELSRLAGKVAVMDGSESSEGDADDVSLTEGLLKTSHNLWLAITGAIQLPEGLAFGFEAELAEPQVSNGMFVFLLIVAGTVVAIYFIHLVMAKLSREGPLLAALNDMDRDNRLKVNENDSLHEELVKTRTELENVASRVTTSSGDVDEISSQLEIVKSEYANEKSQLEERVVQLEHELEEATTNGLEMHKMLSEMLSSQKDVSSFEASVDHLQSMLDGQREKVETLTSDLAMKNRLNEELHNELSASMERASKLEYQVEQLSHSLEDLTGVKGEAIRKLQEEAALVEELKTVNISLTKQTGEHDTKISSLTNELSELRDTLNQLRETVETKESELQVAKECLKQLRLTSSDDCTAPDEDKLSALFDVIKVKADLHKVNNDRLTLVEQLQDAEMAQKNLEDTMASIRTEVSELRTHHDVAIREKQEAMSKLEVLTKYFEEKEAQLTKELESQEGLRVNAEGSAAAVSNKMMNYELELASYKTQVESLRKELEVQESSYKSQISSHEQKAHENWLQARAAERKHEEQRQESSQLRSRLTLMQKEKEEVQQAQVNIIKPTPKRVDANGTMSSPRPMVDGIDADHSGLPSLHRDLDSPPIPHPMHGPPMLPMMFPPGGPLPPGVPPPHGLPPGVPPPPHGLPPGVPPPHLPHGLPHHPFLPGEPPFMGPLHPLPGDRRLPPAGGMSSPPFRRTGSPSYDHRNDRYSPLSDRSHISDRRYSPPRRRPLSPDMHRNRSPDRRLDRPRSPDRRSDRMMRSPDHLRNDRRSPERRSDRRSPDRHYTRSPEGYTRLRNFYDEPDFNNDDSRLRSHHIKGKKTSTPLGPNDR